MVNKDKENLKRNRNNVGTAIRNKEKPKGGKNQFFLQKACCEKNCSDTKDTYGE